MAKKGAHWTTEPDQEISIDIGSNGYAALPPTTVIQVLKDTVAKNPNGNALALKRPVNGVVPEDWKFWTWSECYQDCRAFAKSLIHLDVKPFHIVNILGFNSVRKI